MMIIILLLNILIFSISANVIKELPLYSTDENIGNIIGISFCSLVMIALFIAYVVVIIKAYRLQKEVINKNT